MLSDIFGEDKREKFQIILSLIKDRDITGIIYGKRGIGKKFLISKLVKEVSTNKDRAVFIEGTDKWHLHLLQELGINADENISREEFLIELVNFLEGFPGRLFVVVNNGQNLSPQQISQLLHLIGFKDRISTIIIGDETLKEKLNPFKLGKVEASLNFVFEVRPPEPEEFIRYFNEKYSGKIEKKALKKLYSLTGGSIKDAENIIMKIGRFPVKAEDISQENRNYLPVFVIIITVSATALAYWLFVQLYTQEKEQAVKTTAVKKINIQDKKLPEEGVIEEGLPVKPKRKKEVPLNKELEYVTAKIAESLKNEDWNIPELKFRKPEYRFVLQVASFKNRQNAEKLKNKLSKELGSVSIINRKNGLKTVVIYASGKEEVKKIQKFLTEKGLKPIIRKVDER
ncbi:SPOR domain-containing protein [Persephonella sp.]